MSNDYHQFIDQIKKKLGINLTLYKEAQMKRRLTSLRNNRGFSSFTTYFKALESDQSLLNEFVDRITINVSEFYRNPKRWNVLHKKIFPMLIHSKNKLNVWSAACSTGEEPYSIALMVKEYFPNLDVHILATDIDEKVLEQAERGVYGEQALKDLPKYLKAKYFTEKNGIFTIKRSLKRNITFKKHDLLIDSYPKNIDLIVCRNVLIYFTDDAKHMIYKRFSDSLTDNGVLFVGSTEQIFNPTQYQLSIVETFFYQKSK